MFILYDVLFYFSKDQRHYRHALRRVRAQEFGLMNWDSGCEVWVEMLRFLGLGYRV